MVDELRDEPITEIGRRESRYETEAAFLREHDKAFAEWAKGHGVVNHEPITQVLVDKMQRHLERRGGLDREAFFELMRGLDLLTNAAIRTVAHMTYARNVHLDGRDLVPEDFKEKPQGHMGGSLNVIPGYAAYLAYDVATDQTRAWLLGQGHTVSAVDAVNVLVGNMTEAHAERYDASEQGLTRLARDFYGREVEPDGSPSSPLGSHVNVHTAGGMIEGGFLGFAELLYPHMPLPGEKLVVFLSDGSFEEQRGVAWAPRWWRAEDSGLIMPIMMNNGRRIDQRTMTAQIGGARWLEDYLRLNGFEPLTFDGKDPAAFMWAIHEMERRLETDPCTLGRDDCTYPAPIPFGIAVAPKGYGFYGADTEAAHNLPVGKDPAGDDEMRAAFNESVRTLFVPPEELDEALKPFRTVEGRPREKDNAVANRDVRLDEMPELAWVDVPPAEERGIGAACESRFAMEAIDDAFVRIVKANPHLRPRFGNPDESRSNRMYQTLDLLEHRVDVPEPGVEEDVLGNVITVLNEEAVVCAALGNKGGISISVTYEAFGVKMLSAVRQEIVWANHAREAGRPPKWLSIPVVLTSHTWENGKNEQSHQDPTMCEALLGEVSDVSRVVFPVDHNTATATMEALYRTHGSIWTVVAAKEDMPCFFDRDEARTLVADGGMRVGWAGYDVPHAKVAITAIGSYQLREALKASERLARWEVPHRVVYLYEPGRFRTPRTPGEHAHLAAEDVRAALYGDIDSHVLITHTRPEIMLGTLSTLRGSADPVGLGYISHGGTYDIDGMLFANRSTWAHVVEGVAHTTGHETDAWLSDDEAAAVRGERAPMGVLY